MRRLCWKGKSEYISQWSVGFHLQSRAPPSLQQQQKIILKLRQQLKGTKQQWKGTKPTKKCFHSFKDLDIFPRLSFMHIVIGHLVFSSWFSHVNYFFWTVEYLWTINTYSRAGSQECLFHLMQTVFGTQNTELLNHVFFSSVEKK